MNKVIIFLLTFLASTSAFSDYSGVGLVPCFIFCGRVSNADSEAFAKTWYPHEEIIKAIQADNLDQYKSLKASYNQAISKYKRHLTNPDDLIITGQSYGRTEILRLAAYYGFNDILDYEAQNADPQYLTRVLNSSMRWGEGDNQIRIMLQNFTDDWPICGDCFRHPEYNKKERSMVRNLAFNKKFTPDASSIWIAVQECDTDVVSHWMANGIKIPTERSIYESSMQKNGMKTISDGMFCDKSEKLKMENILDRNGIPNLWKRWCAVSYGIACE
ncbi:hypothetical protein [Burkholderia ubonensis]|uniref:hypothetical protein n=1 Tax=Burkholderia ubonensis TaxID=101571 RepID=UPI000AD00108|nr:hypothetical protein [Burkholderia ubonensis]